VTVAAPTLTASFERLLLALWRQTLRVQMPAIAPLPPAQRLALGAIVDAGALRVGPLAERLGTTPATATRTVDALVAAGLVERRSVEHDRRGVEIAPTAAGRAVLAERRLALAALVDGLAGELDAADAERLCGLLAELAALLESTTRAV
jgi:DNA-binding MarR family transcriptional regulator